MSDSAQQAMKDQRPMVHRMLHNRCARPTCRSQYLLALQSFLPPTSCSCARVRALTRSAAAIRASRAAARASRSRLRWSAASTANDIFNRTDYLRQHTWTTSPVPFGTHLGNRRHAACQRELGAAPTTLPSKYVVSSIPVGVAPCSSSPLVHCLLPQTYRNFPIRQRPVTSVLLNLILPLLKAVPLKGCTLLVYRPLPPQCCNLTSPYRILALGQLTPLLLTGQRLKR